MPSSGRSSYAWIALEKVRNEIRRGVSPERRQKLERLAAKYQQQLDATPADSRARRRP